MRRAFSQISGDGDAFPSPGRPAPALRGRHADSDDEMETDPSDLFHVVIQLDAPAAYIEHAQRTGRFPRKWKDAPARPGGSGAASGDEGPSDSQLYYRLEFKLGLAEDAEEAESITLETVRSAIFAELDQAASDGGDALAALRVATIRGGSRDDAAGRPGPGPRPEHPLDSSLNPEWNPGPVDFNILIKLKDGSSSGGGSSSGAGAGAGRSRPRPEFDHVLLTDDVLSFHDPSLAALGTRFPGKGKPRYSEEAKKELVALSEAIRKADGRTRQAEIDVAFRLAVRSGHAFRALWLLFFGANFTVDNRLADFGGLLGHNGNHVRCDARATAAAGQFLDDLLYLLGRGLSGLEGDDLEREIPAPAGLGARLQALTGKLESQGRVVDFLLRFARLLPEGLASAAIDAENIVCACRFPVGRDVVQLSLAAGRPLPPAVSAYVCFAAVPEKYAWFIDGVPVPSNRGANSLFEDDIRRGETREYALQILLTMSETERSLAVVNALDISCGSGYCSVEPGLLYETLAPAGSSSSAELGGAVLRAVGKCLRLCNEAGEGDAHAALWGRAVVGALVRCRAAVAARVQQPGWVQDGEPVDFQAHSGLQLSTSSSSSSSSSIAKGKAVMRRVVKELRDLAGDGSDAAAAGAVAVLRCLLDRADVYGGEHVSMLADSLVDFADVLCPADPQITRSRARPFALFDNGPGFPILRIFFPKSSEVVVRAAGRLYPLLLEYSRWPTTTRQSRADARASLALSARALETVQELEALLARKRNQVEVESPPAFLRFFKHFMVLLPALSASQAAGSYTSSNPIDLQREFPHLHSLANQLEEDFDGLFPSDDDDGDEDGRDGHLDLHLRSAKAGALCLFQEKDADNSGRGAELHWLVDAKVPREVAVLCGWAMGMCLSLPAQPQHVLPLSLPAPFYAYLLGKRGEPDFALLQEVEPVLARNLKEADYASDACEFYFVSIRDGAELVPGGAEKRVTPENKNEYIELSARAHFESTGFVSKMRLIREGFKAAAADFLRTRASVTPRELKQMVEGQKALDVEDIAGATVYEGYSEDSPQIVWLFEYLREAGEAGRAAFVQCATGCPRAPPGGFRASKNRFKFAQLGTAAHAQRYPIFRSCFYTGARRPPRS
eukprot:tig00000411_g523.t1